ncbi:MAG: iron-containing alcohol dehydrogenase family protein [Phycisphaerae bacterium]
MIDAQLLTSSPVRVVFGSHALAQLGAVVEAERVKRAMIVTDPAIRVVGYLGRAVHHLHECFIETVVFDQCEANPTTATVARGLEVARRSPPDLIIGLGGGSAMDCAKAINLLLQCGGQMSDYRGDPATAALDARRPLLPMVLVPTTAGTGSEAQSFAIIADATTHMKMPCGDRRSVGGLRPRVAILDPVLTDTVPPRIAAATGIDAITHAVETAGCRVRTEVSRRFSIEAWRRLATAFPLVMSDPHDESARGDMLLGAHLAGCAIENSMLGAAHACANPLTAKYEIAHGVAVGIMLPHVIRFNARDGDENPYAALDRSPSRLAATIESLLDAGEIPRRLRDVGVERETLPTLAEQAAAQWTAGFNPVPVGAAEMLTLYSAAL